jgi:hypothetical protein
VFVYGQGTTSGVKGHRGIHATTMKRRVEIRYDMVRNNYKETGPEVAIDLTRCCSKVYMQKYLFVLFSVVANQRQLQVPAVSRSRQMKGGHANMHNMKLNRFHANHY